MYCICCYMLYFLEFFLQQTWLKKKMGMCIFATSFYVIISMVFTAFAYVVVVVIQEEFKNLNKD